MSDPIAAHPSRALVLVRVLTLYPVPLSWAETRPAPGVVALLVALVASTCLLALRWAQVVSVVQRHPALSVVDVGVSLALLWHTGADSPFIAYTMTTAVLIGLFFSRVGAVLLTALLASGYLLVTRGGEVSSLGDTLGVPLAYVVLAAAASAFRDLHLRLADALNASLTAERSAAVASERTRLARDLHDGLSSTLQGLVLQSVAVGRAVGNRQPVAEQMAGELEVAARSALAQSREVLTGLRREDDSAPLVQAVADRSARWSERTGVPLDFRSQGVADAEASLRITVLRVLDEALENVHRHAGAARVAVDLVGDPGSVTLTVMDDGTGLGRRPGVRDGHYGIVGMTERAAAVGGSLWVEDVGGPGDDTTGTRVRLVLPRVPEDRLGSRGTVDPASAQATGAPVTSTGTTGTSTGTQGTGTQGTDTQGAEARA